MKTWWFWVPISQIIVLTLIKQGKVMESIQNPINSGKHYSREELNKERPPVILERRKSAKDTNSL